MYGNCHDVRDMSGEDKERTMMMIMTVLSAAALLHLVPTTTTTTGRIAKPTMGFSLELTVCVCIQREKSKRRKSERHASLIFLSLPFLLHLTLRRN